MTSVKLLGEVTSPIQHSCECGTLHPEYGVLHPGTPSGTSRGPGGIGRPAAPGGKQRSPPGPGRPGRGPVARSPQHYMVEDAGRRPRTKSGVEDPGRRAGPKVPDEERKGIQAGTGGPRGTTVVVDLTLT